MMKSASLSRSTVFVCVPWNRLDTEAPKKLGERRRRAGRRLHELETAKAGRDSVARQREGPVKSAAARNQVGRAGVAVEARGTDQDRGGLAGVDDTRPARCE